VNNFTDYSKKNTVEYEQNDINRIKFREQTKELIELAKDVEVFGGRRFLGLNANGTEVWVSYKIDRNTLNLEMSATHDLNSIVEFAPKRVTVGMNEPAPTDLMHARATDTGAVTHNTIRYIQRLIDLPQAVGRVDGRCSTQLFMFVSNAIYEGKWGLGEKKVRWRDILDAWDFPSGRYFTVYG